MDTDTGRFVDIQKATPDMNKYAVGQIIEIRGDCYQIDSIDNGGVGGHGRIVLRALSKAERVPMLEALRDAYAGNNLSDPPRNRAERRQRDRDLSRAIKR